LLLGFAAQIIIGARLLWQRGWPPRLWPRIQTISGAALALFLIQHISAALLTRAVKPEIDTNIYWAASVVSRPEFAAYFAPYYAIGLAALIAHLSAWIAMKKRMPRLAYCVLGSGFLASVTLVGALMDGFHPIESPDAYKAYLDAFWF